MASQYARTYNSFSGIDIVPIFNGNSIGECQGLSYSVSREKAPLYTLGSPNPRSFSRGKRGIAGAVVFLVFDRSALFESMKDNSYFWGNNNEKPPEIDAEITRTNNLGQFATGVIGNSATLEGKTLQKAYYHDQIPPFDIKLIAATERGHGAMMEILGVEILNCGSGISVDDITTDESCTWIGVNIIPWHSQTYNDPTTGEASSTVQTSTTSPIEGTAFSLLENP
jgi:hypothetical protein